VRGTWRGLGAAVRHRLSSKLVLQTERSNTSFLGLTDADFAADPYRRYVAAALDEFHRWRTQLELSDQIRFGAATTLTAVAYRSDVHRVAYRFVRFRNGPSITSVLANPDALPILPYFHLLNGAADNSDSERTLLYEHNDYRYVSQGVQADARWQRRGGAYRHEVRSGARAHYDSIERAISTDAFRMLSRRLVADRARVLVGDDRAETMALSAYAQYALGWRKVTLAPGARVEALTMRFDDRDDDRRVDGSLVELMPGASLLYDPTAAVRAFAGVYRGFTPPSPAGIATTSAETSINYELGARLDAARATRVELTGFVSDHDHIRSECIDGCNDLDEAFNAGRVIIGGVEAAAQRRFRLGGYELPVEASYAFTASSFRTAFVSTDPQLGAVEVGDELPYVPAHQASLGLGLERRGRFALRVRGLYIAPMREEASQGDQGRRTDAQWLLDAAGSLRVTPRVTLLLRGDNLLDRAPIVARRPYGARTTRPLQLEVGLRLDL